MKARLWKDKRGISVMQDAILFCVMVSLSGAILMPAFTSNTIQKTYIEKENEEKANEVLYSFLSSKADIFGYISSEELMDTIVSGCPFVNVNSPSGLYPQLKKSILGEVQMHKSYGDLCTECVISQMNLFGVKANIFTQDFTDNLKININNFLSQQLGKKYNYNFTCCWAPIEGLNFGGYIAVGPSPPSQAYTSRAIEIIPYVGSFTWESIKNKISSGSIQQIYETFLANNDELGFKKEMQEELQNLVYKILFTGCGQNLSSVMNYTLDYTFSEISHYLQNGLEIINKTLALFGIQNIIGMVIQTIENLVSEILGIDGPADSLNILKDVVEERAQLEYNSILSKKIGYITEFIIENKENISDSDINNIIFDWLSGMIEFTKISFSLSIWEVNE